jgi:hypothetical protein
VREACALSLFNPPEYGDVVKFADGSKATVSQDSGCGWYLNDEGRRICQSGFDMRAFIHSLLVEDRRRQEAA